MIIFGSITFSSDELEILNNIKLHDANFYEDDPKAIIHVRLLAWHNRLKQRKAFKKETSKELMSTAWHPTRCWDWYVAKDEKKEIERIVTDEK